MNPRLGFALFTVLCLGCGSPPAHLSEADIATIRRIEQEFVAASVARDFDRILAQRTADIVWYPPNAPAQNGPDAVRRFLSTNPPIIRFTATPVETKGYGGIAYNRGSYSATVVVGKDTIVDPGKYVQVWHRQLDGSWRIAFEAWNSDTPITAVVPPKKR